MKKKTQTIIKGTVPTWSPFVDAGRHVRDVIEQDLWKWLCAPTVFESERLIREVNQNRVKRIQKTLVGGRAKPAVAKTAAPVCERLGQRLAEYMENSLDSARAEARQHGATLSAALADLVAAMGRTVDDLPPLSIGRTLLDPAFPPEGKRKRGRPRSYILRAMYQDLAGEWTKATGRKAGVARAGYTGKLTAFGRFLYVCLAGDVEINETDATSDYVAELAQLYRV